MVLTFTLFLDVFPCTGSGYINYTVYSHSPEMDDFNHTQLWVEGTSKIVPLSTVAPPHPDMDVVEKFLEHVEQYGSAKGNCTKGTHYNLGKGVIRQYGLKRFKDQAMAAVNAANFYTRIWMRAGEAVTRSEYLFYTMVRSMVEGDPDIFAAGNCYDLFEYYGYYLFCPYAYIMEDGRINAKDLSLEYDYLVNDSEWFITARERSSQLENFNYTYGECTACLIFIITFI